MVGSALEVGRLFTPTQTLAELHAYLPEGHPR